MTNVLRRKSLMCFEWTLTISTTKTFASDAFSFQDHKCHLEFSFVWYTSGYGSSNLFFKSDTVVQSPIKATVRVATDSGTLGTQTLSITSANQSIWNSSANLNGCLLTFEVIMHSDLSTSDKSLQTPSYIDTSFFLGSISHDFSKLLDDGLNHDVEFTCGDQSIRAHKNILCSRSEVFASMLKSDMVEGKTGRINIQDVDAAIFQQFLKCLYSGILPELTVDVAVQFYKASDKYAVDTLRKQCGDFLTDNLCRENACDVLVLADRHSDSDLKKNVMEYVFKEKIPIVGETWADFCKENPILAVEVLNSFCQYQHLSYSKTSE